MLEYFALQETEFAREHVIHVGMVDVTFRVPADVGAERVAVCGDFNDWSPDMAMGRLPDGSFELVVPLCVGGRYQYRFFIDGHRWENDRSAGLYAPNVFGGYDSVIDLTDAVSEHLGETVPDANVTEHLKEVGLRNDAPNVGFEGRGGSVDHPSPTSWTDIGWPK